MSLTCHDCPAPYGSWPDYYVEPVIWSAYGPTGHEGGLLCLNCFAQRMAVHADQRRTNGETFVRINPIFAAKITGTAQVSEQSEARGDLTC